MPLKQRRVSWDFCFYMRCEMPGKCDRFEEVMMVKRTHGEKRHTIRGMGLARRKQKPCKRSVLRKSCTFIEIFFKNRLTKSRRDGKIYRQSAVAVKIESGRVPEWPMGTDCKSAAFSFGGSNPPAPTKQEKSEPISDWRRVRIFRFLRVQQ